MARITTHTDFGKLLHDLTSLDADAMTDDMIKAAEPVMLNNVKKRAASHKASGDMFKSIKSTGIKKNKTGKYLVVRPTGKDGKGVRNMEKLAYLEYGTYKQRATPVITPAVKESEKPIEGKFDEIFDKYTKKVKL